MKCFTSLFFKKILCLSVWITLFVNVEDWIFISCVFTQEINIHVKSCWDFSTASVSHDMLKTSPRPFLDFRFYYTMVQELTWEAVAPSCTVFILLPTGLSCGKTHTYMHCINSTDRYQGDVKALQYYSILLGGVCNGSLTFTLKELHHHMLTN